MERKPWGGKVPMGAWWPVMASQAPPAVCEPYEVVLPLEVTTPLRFALVVTVAALPVVLIESADEGGMGASELTPVA